MDSLTLDIDENWDYKITQDFPPSDISKITSSLGTIRVNVEVPGYVERINVASGRRTYTMLYYGPWPVPFCPPPQISVALTTFTSDFPPNDALTWDIRCWYHICTSAFGSWSPACQRTYPASSGIQQFYSSWRLASHGLWMSAPLG